MNQQRLKAYLDVIQGLLSCPQGEEWILLRQHQELVNPELIEVMEQVANHFTAEGDIKAAKYLHNWAGKLHHILTDSVPVPQDKKDKTQAYVELIQALLSCANGSESEILAAHQDLIGPELVKVMKEVASQLAVKGDQATANYLHGLATELNRTWLQQHEFKPTLKKEIAPDPWLDENSDLPETATATKSDDLETPPSKKTEEPRSSSTQPQVESEPQLAPQLKAIADSLIRLETTLASRLQPLNPLWYMDVLEKATAANWILTTDEVEQLIGIKPHCHHDETSYHRGSWLFIKSGKIGSQLGWRVEKNQDS
ncbi:MAG: hypothetical protein WBM44_20475 [Waterburya sp.]